MVTSDALGTVCCDQIRFPGTWPSVVGSGAAIKKNIGILYHGQLSTICKLLRLVTNLLSCEGVCWAIVNDARLICYLDAKMFPFFFWCKKFLSYIFIYSWEQYFYTLALPSTKCQMVRPLNHDLSLMFDHDRSYLRNHTIFGKYCIVIVPPRWLFVNYQY